MTTMDDLGDWINKPGLKTRDGRDVMILGENPHLSENDFARFIGYVFCKEKVWDKNGCVLNASSDDNIIFPAPKVKKVEIWQNVCKAASGEIFIGKDQYNSKDDGVRDGRTTINYITTIKTFEFEIEDNQDIIK